MRPILLKGHERAITCVVYNNDGDLVFTAAKDQIPSLWYAKTGERIGTYQGHQGAVWDLSVSWDSTRMLSASADASARMWDVQTGRELVVYNHMGPVRSVSFAEGGQRFATVSDPFTDSPGLISVFEAPDDVPTDQLEKIACLEIDLPPKMKATKVVWGALNEKLIVAYADGTIRTFDPFDGTELEYAQVGTRQGRSSGVHSKDINRLCINKDRTLLLTCSKDYTSKLLDANTLQVLKTYKTDRPVNASVMHPTKEHVILGGGQDAMSVTTTSSNVVCGLQGGAVG
ncbi:eukaryotic initiation factor eIF3 i subunit p36 [Ectocarpus siliculosus]|uniref:Serine-threonine kinase receptor-associated protein n=1 Tax=Ectocarpus siliculosus TaxID=2880 RepID=D8LIC2_ECTSI|nr:eukaryotic initiation factor eIF3 i subunit p36 [Ectocarpus siliculosus]|eukprot:CBN79425.1 eukaryotic initiation factor eIF3 i subunit p36 [Ectocarpus siliculosus]